MSSFYILAIDGGGLRGIVPVRILQEIERITQKRIHDIFDMVSGTSTGGLLASCLTLRDDEKLNQPAYSLEKIAEIYIDRGKDIFPIKSGIEKLFREVTNLFFPAFNPKGLDEILKEYAKEKRIKDSLLPILVSTYDLATNKPVFFKTSEAHGDATANARIHDICRATSAAPTYLPPYSFTYKGNKLIGIDGGVYVNNPAMAALAEINRYGQSGFYKKRNGMPVKFEDIRVLSLGTGSYIGPVAVHKTFAWGEVQWVMKIIDIMMNGVSTTTDYETNEMIDKPGEYLRLNIDIAKDFSDMADARPSTMKYLENEVTRQIISDERQMKSLKEFLWEFF